MFLDFFKVKEGVFIFFFGRFENLYFIFLFELKGFVSFILFYLFILRKKRVYNEC